MVGDLTEFAKLKVFSNCFLYQQYPFTRRKSREMSHLTLLSQEKDKEKRQNVFHQPSAEFCTHQTNRYLSSNWFSELFF